jgi:hypothetical protein
MFDTSNNFRVVFCSVGFNQFLKMNTLFGVHYLVVVVVVAFVVAPCVYTTQTVFTLVSNACDACDACDAFAFDFFMTVMYNKIIFVIIVS